ncbi:MAG: hypothetical protein H0W72_17225, partial [Planctomycetes bacterium]|nr:hypothetical protein [Planctomycetota bacterium]
MDSVGDARDLADAGASSDGRVASNAAMAPDVLAPVEVPLCVDLDGTLVRCDCMVEAGLAVLRREPWLAFALPVWWARGRAHLKRELAQRARIDPATLPYDAAVLDHLRGEHARGRRLVLATGSDGMIADGVAAHLCLFSEVFASDGLRSLTGVAKQRALVERFGEKGFDYVANDVVDLAVWRSARAAVVVDATPALV